jgi:hypothetical protein
MIGGVCAAEDGATGWDEEDRTRVLEVGAENVLVWTTRSPGGQRVPIEWAQNAIDRLESEREIEISVASVGYRSAFIGAVLQQLPGAEVVRSTPPNIRLPHEPSRLARALRRARTATGPQAMRCRASQSQRRQRGLVPYERDPLLVVGRGSRQPKQLLA